MSEDFHRPSTIQPVSGDGNHAVPTAEVTRDRPHSSGFRRFLIPGIVGLLFLGSIGWIVVSRVILPMIFASQMKPQPTPVVLDTPTSGTIADSSDYAANLDSRQSVTLQPRVSGQISAIYVQAGDRVEAGQPLIQIDAAEQNAAVASLGAAAETAAADVDAARADVANAIDNVEALQARRASALADVQLNQREYERYQNLYAQGATSRQVLDQRLTALRSSQADLREAEAELQAQQSSIARARAQVVRNQRALEQAQANIAQGNAQLGYYTITAPYAGIVGEIPAKVGDVVNTSSPLLTVTQNQQLEVEIAIPLQEASRLRTGLPVQLLNEENEVQQTGQISFVSPDVDPATQSVQVQATFANSGNQLRTAQFVRARVIWNQEQGLLVPTTAISRLAGRNFIFVAAPFSESGCEAPTSPTGDPLPIDPNQLVAAQKPITLGKIVGNDQEVLEGLTATDRIITSGILQLQNCAPIAEETGTPATP